MKAMLAEGLTPPYAWDALDNTRRYKLVSKVTFTDNLLFHTDHDNTALASFGGIHASGFEHILNKAILATPVLAANPYLSYHGPVFVLNFNFI